MGGKRIKGSNGGFDFVLHFIFEVTDWLNGKSKKSMTSICLKYVIHLTHFYAAHTVATKAPSAPPTYPQCVVVSLQLSAQSLQFAAGCDAALTFGLQLLQDTQLLLITVPQGCLHTHTHTHAQVEDEQLVFAAPVMSVMISHD